MDLSTLSPYIRRAMDHTAEKLGWQLRERVIFDYELLYVKEGEVLINIEGTEYRGVPGDLFLLKPRRTHSIRSVGSVPLRQPHIHFDLYYRPDSPDVKISFKPIKELSPEEMGWFREDVCSSPPFQLPEHFRPRSPTTVEQMLMDLIADFRQKLPFYELKAKGRFIELWAYLLREWHWAQNKLSVTSRESLMSVKDYLSRHLDRNVTVDELARMANMSRHYLIRAFRNAFGTTPMKYHQTMRIEKAKEWIQYTTDPITEIADRLGFESIHAFSRSFRSIEGVPPSFYRRRNA